MFPTLTTRLSPEQQQRLHADFLKNEQAYLKMRADILSSHPGQWVAVQEEKVIAAGTDLLAVLEKAAAAGGHPYIAWVGAEDQPIFRVRAATFAYDRSYQPFPLPRITATFSNHSETHSQTYSDVIPDTGADVSMLPASDCAAIDLYNSPYLTGITSGVIGSAVAALFYSGKVEIEGNRFSALIQPLPSGRERLLGRDVMNQKRVLFDGPARQVVIDP